MDTKLINYDGLDDIYNYETKWSYPYKIEGVIPLTDNIKDILSFSIEKECISYKILDTFERINLNNEEFFANLLVVNNKFHLNFQYGNNENISRLNMITKTIYDASFKSLDNLDSSDLSIMLLTKDLFCTKINENKIYYCINLLILVNES